MALSDAKVIALYRQREELKERQGKIAKKITKISDALTNEFERRGTKSIEHDGQRVTYVAPETVQYLEPVLRRLLSRSKRGRAIIARCEKTILDMKAIASEVQAGTISSAVVAKASDIKPSKPYVTGSKVQ